MRTLPDDGRQRLDRFELEDDYAVSHGERTAHACVRPKVAIKVGAGQYDDKRAVRICAAERVNGTSIASGVERHEAVDRFARPALSDLRAVAEVF